MRQHLENIHAYIGAGNLFTLSNNEVDYRNRQKIPVAARNLNKGQIVSMDDISFKISSESKTELITNQSTIIGKHIIKDIKKDCTFTQDQFGQNS